MLYSKDADLQGEQSDKLSAKPHSQHKEKLLLYFMQIVVALDDKLGTVSLCRERQ